MKLKIILLIAGLIIGGGITVIVIRSPSRQLQLPVPVESQLPTVISNYNKTFKLKTSPPIWGEPTTGATTNANH